MKSIYIELIVYWVLVLAMTIFVAAVGGQQTRRCQNVGSINAAE